MAGNGSTENWRSFGKNSADLEGGRWILILCTFAGKAVELVSSLREANKAEARFVDGSSIRHVEFINAVVFPDLFLAHLYRP